jgi:thioredoxin reductase (NADPH)
MQEVIIIGSGPAGCTAGLYTARAGLSPLLIEGPQPGGQLISAAGVENFPGFPDGIAGVDLMQLVKTQAERFGTRFLSQSVSKVDLSNRPFKVFTETGCFESRALIIATGAIPRRLDLKGEQILMGRGVSTCATCDGYFFRGRHVAVVGGGDMALEEAIFLSKHCSKVTLIHRRDRLRASKVLQQRALTNPKIEILYNTVINEVYDVTKLKLTGLRLKDTKADREMIFECEGLFIAIGHEPNTSIFKGQVELDTEGYIRTHSGTCTSVEGVFACGDVVDSRYRQAVTAAGSGCMAALDCQRFLEGHG